MRTICTAVGFLLTSVLCGTAINIGDPAPGLFVEQWIKGSPTRIAPGTNIYVVEFWATWCPPCRESIPHLTQLQKKYAKSGVIITGISGESAAKVAPFVAAQGEQMGYRVAVDPSDKTSAAWMRPFGESGIPHAFVVDRAGKLVWHGFPNSRLDRVLEQLIEGKFDVEAERINDTGTRMIQGYVQLASKRSTAEKAAPVGQKILTEYSRSWVIPFRLAEAILTEPSVVSRDVQLALKAADKAVEMTGGRSPDAFEMQARGLFATGKKQEAIEVQKKAMAICNDASDMARLKKFMALYEKGAQAPPRR